MCACVCGIARRAARTRIKAGNMGVGLPTCCQVPDGTLEDAFRQRYPDFRPANDGAALPAAA